MRVNRFLAGAAGLVIAASSLSSPADAAETHSYTVKSSDGGAQAKAKITWYSSSRFAVDWSSCDLRSDGRGPIFYVNQQIETDAIRSVVYDHDFSGKDSCDLSYTDVNRPEYQTKFVVIKECNGGSKYDAERCDELYLKNPYIAG